MVKIPSGIRFVYGVQILRRSLKKRSEISLDSSSSSRNSILGTGNGLGSGKFRSGREIESSSVKDPTSSGSAEERGDGERGKEQARNLSTKKRESETMDESGIKEGEVG
ncbi:hypothetical protein PUN28_013988 [Cardiocondyla obscurior]|uniref:Uncharacterized protein n=1 Tax=Cardiocondyla obscurior TaxID=286306 RepID=A0AAW2F5I3_9HYME